MENLINSGLELRTIRAEDYQTLCENLQYNFNQILSLSGFKGRKGDKGDSISVTGDRGSLWFFGDYEKFKSIFPEINNATDINLSFLNDKLKNNIGGLTEAFRIPTGVDLFLNDIVVLPSGEVYQIIEVGDDLEFTNTSISFSEVSTITLEQVISIVNSLLEPYAKGESFFVFDVYGKNASDEQPSLNTDLTTKSAIDLNVVGAGSGVLIPNYKVFSGTENLLTENTKLGTILGSPTNYHKILQQTQKSSTNESAPNYGSFPSLVVLQNDANSGFLFGNLNTTFDNFGALFHTGTKIILKSNNTPINGDFGSIELNKDLISLNTKSTKINSDTTISGLLKTNYYIETLSYSAGELVGKPTVSIGKGADMLTLENSRIKLSSFLDANFLTTDALGFVKSLYKLTNTITDNDPNSTSNVVTSYAVRNYITDKLNVALKGSVLKTDPIITNGKNKSLDTYIVTGSYTFTPDNIPFDTPNKNDNGELIFFNELGFYANLFVTYNPKVVDDNLNGFIKQVITYNTDTVNNDYDLAGIVTYTRFGILKNGTASFGMWDRTLGAHTTNLHVDGNSLKINGSFFNNNLEISHKTVSATISQSTTVPKTVNCITQLQFDGYGHVTRVISTDFTNLFNKTDSPIDNNTLNNISTVDAVESLNKLNSPFSVYTNAVTMRSGYVTDMIATWQNIQNQDVSSNDSWHNLPKYHSVRWRFDGGGSGRGVLGQDSWTTRDFYITLEITYSPPKSIENDPYDVNFSTFDVHMNSFSLMFEENFKFTEFNIYESHYDHKIIGFSRLIGEDHPRSMYNGTKVRKCKFRISLLDYLNEFNDQHYRIGFVFHLNRIKPLKVSQITREQ